MDKGGGWMSANGTIIIEGGIHSTTTVPGCVASSVVRYTESSNSWDRSIQQLFPNFDGSFPDGQGGGSIGHGYHHDTVVSAAGDMYHRQYNSGKVMKFSNSTQNWSQCNAIPGNQQVAGALEYFPNRNSLVWLDGDWGVWELSLASGNCTSASWQQRASANGGGFSPQLTGLGSYSNQSRYSPRCACVVLGGGGGGNTLYKYNSDGTFSNVTSTGAPPSIKIPGDNSGTVFTIDPVTGYVLAWSNFDAHTTIYQYDPLNDVWASISNTSPFFPTPEGQNTNAIAIPIETYGVIMFITAHDTSGGSVYLYKHAAGSSSTPPPPATTPPPDTQAPTAPTNPMASVVSSSQITLSWTVSTDNVAVTGYLIERCQGSGCSNFAQITTSSGTTFTDAGLSASTSYSYRVRATDAAGNLSAYSTVASGTTQAGSTVVSGGGTGVPVSGGGTTADQNFAQRCNSPGVIKCVTFDSSSDLAGTYGDPFGILPGDSTPVLDSTVKASGNSSIKFTIPSNSGANSSGSYFTNFSDNLSTQFGENSEFYIQWRQRFSPEFLNTVYQGGGGWKQSIIGTGDKPGCSASAAASGLCYSSCSTLETVTQNTFQRGFPQMYNSCTGSTSHGPYDPFNQAFGAYDFKLQNGRPAPYCLYSQGQTNPVTYFPPSGNCFGYFANEWMTFQVHIKTGPRVNDEFTNSFVQLWVAREGQPSQLVLDWGPYNLSAGSAAENQLYGKIWLLPYNTGKDSSQSYPTAYTWYDELIISMSKIADPNTGSTPSTQPPTAPTNLTLQ
jgi:chitodextrinase